MNKQDEDKVRQIIKAELVKFDKNITKKVNQSIDKNNKEVNLKVDKTTDDLKKELIKKIDLLKKEGLDKAKIIDLMSKAFKQQNKFMWEKSDFITQYLKTV